MLLRWLSTDFGLRQDPQKHGTKVPVQQIATRQ
jgi:hypothetical protein